MMKSLVSTGNRYESLPEQYKRPLSDRPNLSQVFKEAIPLIDLGCPDRAEIVRQTGEACRLYGFFQVINHGISGASVQEIMGVTREFFHLPVEEKMKLYSVDPVKKIRLSTSFNNNETAHSWRDFLRFSCYPLENFMHEWPSSPTAFKEVVSKYCTEVQELGLQLLEYISESLGLERKHIEKALAEEQTIVLNFYPPCPEPDLTYGIPGHTDPYALTILLPDQEVAGLQVRRAGKWIAIDPHPSAFIINLGDQIQALSNDKYKSLWHRAIVNSDKERISVASFFSPGNNVVIRPAEQLTSNELPAIYRDYTYVCRKLVLLIHFPLM
ncbi:flavanone 3-dioxygenase 2-like isoform X2 [Aristolochia californica]|uniref:flavanone 3-dioxygenase 2-like isoform X2 n=1 Tax=Aristolochia californica TaxID=171875 RepID=UPI0035DDCB8B